MSSSPGPRGGSGAAPGSAVPPGHGTACRLQLLAEAIDDLDRAVRAEPVGEASASDLAGRLSALWEMVAGLDPDVAARLAGY